MPGWTVNEESVSDGSIESDTTVTLDVADGKDVGEGKGKSAWTPMMIMRPNTDECCMVAFTRLVAQ